MVDEFHVVPACCELYAGKGGIDPECVCRGAVDIDVPARGVQDAHVQDAVFFGVYGALQMVPFIGSDLQPVAGKCLCLLLVGLYRYGDHVDAVKRIIADRAKVAEDLAVKRVKVSKIDHVIFVTADALILVVFETVMEKFS